MRKTLSLAVAALLFASLALVACGGTGGASGGGGQGGATTIDLKAVDINWEPKTLNAKVNQPLTINITNGGDVGAQLRCA